MFPFYGYCAYYQSCQQMLLDTDLCLEESAPESVQLALPRKIANRILEILFSTEKTPQLYTSGNECAK
jgi:hypothetical protein